MMGVASAQAKLRQSLQQGEVGTAFERLVGAAVAAPVPRSVTKGGAAGVDGLLEDVEMGNGGGDGMGGVGDDFGGGGDDIGGGGEEGEPPPAKKAKGPKRGAQICNTCGHRKQQGLYKSAHPHPKRMGEGGSCNVPAGEFRPQIERTGRKKPGGKTWPLCNCAKCIAVG